MSLSLPLRRALLANSLLIRPDDLSSLLSLARVGILLSATNLAEGSAANLAVDSEAAGLGLRAVLTPQISDVWRSAAWGATTINLDVDLGSAEAFNVVAIAAPRDGLLPGASALISLGASATAPPSYANLQANPTSIIPGGGSYVIGWQTTNLGSVADPDGGTGARLLGSSSGIGSGVYINRAGTYAASPSTLYDFSMQAYSAATAPDRGWLLWVDEYSGAGGTGTLHRRHPGIALVGSGINGSWQTFTHRITTHADTQSLQVWWASDWQTGAQIGVYGCSIVRRPEVLDTGDAAFSLSPYGLWAWVGDAPITARYLRLAFTGGAADAYLQLGRLWVGPALITTRQASYGFSLGASDPGSSLRASVSGMRDVQRGTAYRTISCTADTLTTAEAAQVEQAAISHQLCRADFALEEDL